LYSGSVVSVTRQLRGTDVLRYDSEERIGSVADVVVHPTEGRVVALVIRTPGGARSVVDVTECSFTGEAVLVVPHSARSADGVQAALERGVLATEDLLGMIVITDTGNCLGYVRDRGEFVGYIRDVYLLPDESRVVYRVGGSFGERSSFYLAGNVPSAYSRPDERMEVPRRAARRLAGESPWEALELAGR
jgi:sporulation protein YlmC with PRC-barrel domain